MKTRYLCLLTAAGLAGCVSVTVYVDYAGPDASILNGNGKPAQVNPMQATAGLLSVDKQPIPGNRFGVDSPPVYVTPGRHWISAFTQAPHVMNYEVPINLTAQHTYRFDVDADENLTLWDVTGAPALSAQFDHSDESILPSYYVASLWDADTDVTDEPPIYDDVGEGGGPHGPDHAGDGHPNQPGHDHPVAPSGHSGGGGGGGRPPPIPHAPRPPSGGGGHSGGGGGRSGGGGGGGHSGGGGGGGHKK